MKKLTLTITVFAAVLAVLHAGGNGESEKSNGKITVVATIFPQYDFVRQIAKDRVNLTMLLRPGAESHSYEPSPKDIITIQNSDVIIYVGNEYWTRRVFQSMNREGKHFLSMMTVIDLVMEEIKEGMEGYHQQGQGSGQSHHDEHVWTSPRNAMILVREITELLCKADPANAVFFRQNAASYIIELQKLDESFKEITAGAKRKTIIFGDRFPLRYFTDAYGLDYYAAFSGCSTQTEASAATVAFLINKVRNERIPIVFYIELSNERMANTISSETGAKKLLFHSCHNVTRMDFNAGLGYLDFMKRNVSALREALF